MLMNLGENIGRSITGSVEKAILCVKKPKSLVDVMEYNEETKKVTDKIIGRKFDVSNSKATSLQSQLMNLSSKEKKAEAIKSGYHILKVKYNPSKIQIDSRAGSFLQQENGSNNRTQINMPSQTFMNFEILFDEENPQDAFMFDKINNISILYTFHANTYFHILCTAGYRFYNGLVCKVGFDITYKSSVNL